MTYDTECPVCDFSFDVDADYEGADPSVGIMAGGANVGEVTCPDCHHTFTERETEYLEERITSSIEERGDYDIDDYDR